MRFWKPLQWLWRVWKYIEKDNAAIDLIIVVTQNGKVLLLKSQDFEHQKAYWIEKVKVLKE